MSYSHRTPTKNSTTPGGCYTTLFVAIGPIAIYFLQLLGKVSTPAACVAGVLVIAKALIEWRVAMRHFNRKQKPAAVPQKLVRLLPIQAPIAGCYLCHQQRHLQEYAFEGMRVGLCQDCHHCISATRSRI